MREIATERFRDLTSPHLRERRERMIEARRAVISLVAERQQLRSDSAAIERKIRRCDGWLRWLLASKKPALEEEARRLMFRQVQVDEDIARLEKEGQWVWDEDERRWHAIVGPAFDRLATCERIWDVTHDRGITHYRSGASESIQRTAVRLRRARVEVLRSDLDSFCFGNANGPEIHLLPGIVAVVDEARTEGVALISFRECNFGMKDTAFHEEDGVPADAQLMGQTWRYVNKDGSRDRRFSHNPSIPICRYGMLTLTSSTGLNECYMFSNLKVAVDFMQALRVAQGNAPFDVRRTL